MKPNGLHRRTVDATRRMAEGHRGALMALAIILIASVASALVTLSIFIAVSMACAGQTDCEEAQTTHHCQGFHSFKLNASLRFMEEKHSLTTEEVMARYKY